jgi:hypothetical protein
MQAFELVDNMLAQLSKKPQDGVFTGEFYLLLARIQMVRKYFII